jgi:hypothetical protein
MLLVVNTPRVARWRHREQEISHGSNNYFIRYLHDRGLLRR